MKILRAFCACLGTFCPPPLRCLAGRAAAPNAAATRMVRDKERAIPLVSPLISGVDELLVIVASSINLGPIYTFPASARRKYLVIKSIPNGNGSSMGRLREMEMFVRVVEGGSFSAAARDLNMGQPAVSKAIAGLEDRLGVRLLVRSTRRLSPTEAGIAFYERALRAIAEANEAAAAAQGLGAGLEGRLRTSAPVTFSRLQVVPKVGEFLEAHPKLQLELVLDDRNRSEERRVGKECRSRWSPYH